MMDEKTQEDKIFPGRVDEYNTAIQPEPSSTAGLIPDGSWFTYMARIPTTSEDKYAGPVSH